VYCVSQRAKTDGGTLSLSLVIFIKRANQERSMMIYNIYSCDGLFHPCLVLLAQSSQSNSDGRCLSGRVHVWSPSIAWL
jgi:hypothetical protein